MLQEIKLLKHFYNTIWEYDPSKRQLYIHHDKMLPDTTGKWFPYEDVYQLHFTNYIYQDDLPVWEHYMSPKAFSLFLSTKRQEAHFFIRTHSPLCGLEWHEAYIERSDDGHLLVISKDIQTSQRNATIAQAVLPEFDYVCRIDITTGSYALYYSNAENTVVPQQASENYEKVMWEFNHMRIIPEEVDTLCQNMKIANVVSQLQKAKDYLLSATVQEADGTITYKKLRFRYADSEKKVLLLTRIDVSEFMREKKKYEEEQKRRLNYLENLPIGFCSTKIILDENQKPVDFMFTYCNKAHEAIEGVSRGELLGKRFYQFFKNADPKWLKYYYETAYKGIPHIIKDYSPEIDKQLLIYTFQTELGNCDCILIDITREYFLETELQKNREEMQRILQTTTSFVFQYQPVERRIYINNLNTQSGNTSYLDDIWFDKMTHLGYLAEPYLIPLKKAFEQMRQGEHYLTLSIRARMKLDVSWSWYRVVLFDYKETNSTRKVLGYLQNIDHDMKAQQKLREKAETDPLTGILNVGGGKKQAISLLKKQVPGTYSAMFVLDIDDFKDINDNHGHLTGDEVLKRFSSALYDSFRSADIVYRLGGDEFAAFASGFQNPEATIKAIIQRFYQNLIPVQKTYPFLTSSIGVYISNKPHTNAMYAYEQYYTEADKELYHAKKTGKNRYSVKIEKE